MTQRHNQPLGALLALALLFTPVLLGAQQPKPADTEPWTIVPMPQASLVLARDGSLIGEIGKEIRTTVSIKSLPKYLPQAFVAVEDHRFYQHDGVDVVGIAGALKDNIFGERRGASTITQQLVGNMHPTIIDRTDRSLGRKLAEQSAAREMEKHYTKEQILEGVSESDSIRSRVVRRGERGAPLLREERVEADASGSCRAGRDAEGAGAVRSVEVPGSRAPAPKRRAVVDGRSGIHHAGSGEERASDADRHVAERRVFRVLTMVRGCRAHSGDARGNSGEQWRLPDLHEPGSGTPERGDGRLLEETASVESQPGYAHPKYARGSDAQAGNATTDYLQGMVVALDPTSGDVSALVGGRDYSDSRFNRAVDGKRQPGSSFKPIVYAAAIADSIPPNAMFADTALAITLPNRTIYRPENSDSQFLGTISLRDALAMSRNVVAVQLGMKLGMDSIAQLAHRMGINSEIAPYPSSAIGASAVQPLDLVAAYTTFANLGTPVEPRFIYRVEDRNRKVVLSREVRALAPALDPRVTYVVRDMMRDVVERGTAASIRRYLPASIPVAGKTGTTNDNSDVWFIGLTPDLVAGVWLGFDKPVSIAAGAGGGSLAAPVFGKMLARYYAAKPEILTSREAAQWTPPVGVIMGDVDRMTGVLATDQTSPESRYTEYFVEGTEPAPLRADPWKVFAWGPIVF